MFKYSIRVAAGALLIAISSSAVLGQAPPAATHWTAGQLDQLTAPIALYPDPLLGFILPASTYPLEVVEAARWLDDPAHATLKGEELSAAVDAQPWDPSVKSLLLFPEVLHLMDSHLEWTEQLGDAFLAQQADVMDSIQRLRQRALAQGTLQSTPQQIVATDQNAITIEPANPDVVYVPYYVPGIFGSWEWPDYPPYFFALPPGVYIGGAFIGFGIGIGFYEPWWGWYGFNWPGRGVVVYPPHERHPGNPPRPYPPHPRGSPQPWRHDPQHRGGVPYRDAATAARYQGADASARHAYRGFPAPAAPPAPAREPAPRVTTPMPPAPRPVTPMPAPAHEKPAAPAPHAGPPVFESFGHGPQVRSEATRGSSSRSAPSAPPGGSGHPGHH